ncbi:uncharacterized protein B0H18DRAFT_996488, partial [Fomitopsis serialis]|uniref:uncharacterized protein n=1 Tax=Fomitopsis serialis TaxID=139415 RepID=UPI00200858A7
MFSRARSSSFQVEMAAGRGRLGLFNLYVALSRSSGRQTIHILREFDDHVFQGAHDEYRYLPHKDERLERR